MAGFGTADGVPRYSMSGSRGRRDNGSMIERFNPSTVHEPAGYSHVTISEAGRLAHLAGQCPLNLAGEVVGVSGDFAAQTAQLITNCLAVLDAAGATPADVVRSVVYVVSPDSDVLSAVWQQLTASPLAAAFTTASTLVGVAALGYNGQLVEIDLTAALESKQDVIPQETPASA
ncbi:RidA family protein [Dactylosporangium sp. NPDC051485]|uniref:RidA family protein n=1 Tax=Dactylosporangium sp. NPDC051485 TaxID=3154846 RepID=UPI003421003B